MNRIIGALALVALSGCNSQPSGPTKAEVLARQQAEAAQSAQRQAVLDDAIACFGQMTSGQKVDCEEKMAKMDAQTAEIQAEANAREVERAR
jgi:hypothetical protein